MGEEGTSHMFPLTRLSAVCSTERLYFNLSAHSIFYLAYQAGMLQ